MPASRSAIVQPSDTSRVTEALTITDDFMTATQIATATGLARNAVTRSLWWLQKARAVEAIESAGDVHWFVTPDTDTRHHTLDERKKEDEPRKAKRPYIRRAK
jgi:DNA-binding transcriptional regulator GbsR (MarR family)